MPTMINKISLKDAKGAKDNISVHLRVSAVNNN